MGCQQNNHRLLFHFVAVILVLAGCAPQMKKPRRVCPGAKSVAESLRNLQTQRQKAVSLKANGQCLVQFYAEGKPHKERFPVKVWVNPPAQIRLHGDVAFNPRGIDLGSNEHEFWLAMKPKEISAYWWGRWAEAGSLSALKINPETLLDALGIAEVGDRDGWSLSNEGAFDILTKRNSDNKITKKIYIYNCDYRIAKIKYFNANGKAVVVTELEYKQGFKGFSVPDVITIVTHSEDDKEYSFRITLKSVKAYNFTRKKQDIFFTSPGPKGFEHIFRIIDGEMIEQPQ